MLLNLALPDACCDQLLQGPAHGIVEFSGKGLDVSNMLTCTCTLPAVCCTKLFCLLKWAFMHTGKRIKQVAAGHQHSLALADDGQVFAWGHGGYGALGLGPGEFVPV